jgi:ABC-type phosphate transport system substrate-binding protein
VDRSRTRPVPTYLSLVATALLATTALPPVAGAGPGAGADAEPPPSVPFRVIVNANNPVTSVDRKFLLDAFLRKVLRWPDDQPIRPIDLRADSPTRRRFSDDALKRSVSAVKSYWMQVIFSGHGVPPPELDSDEQVVKFVQRNPGAVGYVSGTANIDGVKVVAVR